MAGYADSMRFDQKIVDDLYRSSSKYNYDNGR